MKLIDKDTLIDKIEKRMQELHPTNTHKIQVGEKMDRDVLMWLNALSWVKDLLDTLEVKEVDLDREIYDYFNEWQNVLCDEDCCNEGGFCCVLDENVKPVNIARCRKIAKHFFELGLKAKKG